jgi:hypothetical protein
MWAGIIAFFTALYRLLREHQLQREKGEEPFDLGL